MNTTLTAAPDRADVPRPISGRGSASAKAILFGEHSVVYGKPAIAIPLGGLAVHADAVRQGEGEPRLRSSLYTGPISRAPGRLLPAVTAIREALSSTSADGRGLQVRLTSGIPAERGLGSSAAVSAAIVDAICDLTSADLDDDERHRIIQVGETVAHGTSSGLDGRAVRARGPIWFAGGTISPLASAATLHLVVADSGVKGRTSEAVAGVRARRSADPAATDAAIDALGVLATDARAALAAGDVAAIGAGMTSAHTTLTALGVGSPDLDHLVAAATRVGALGAKLTGGGRGGCVIALSPDAGETERIAQAMRSAGAAQVWEAHVQENRS